MELCFLLLLSVSCWQFSCAYIASLETSNRNKHQNLPKLTDEIPLECDDLVIYRSKCSDMQPCGNGFCVCCIDKLYADCSESVHKYKLSSIPPLPSGVQVLKFMHNGLQSQDINQTFFDNVRDLTHLYLSNNRLTYIQRSMFEKLTKLKCLKVNGNALLRKNPESLAEMLAIPGLQELSAAECGFPLENIQFPENSSIEFLYLAYNALCDPLEYDITQLSTLLHLREISFSANAIKYVYTRLPLHIKRLSFYSNALMRFPTTCSYDGRSLFPQLQKLDLTANFLIDRALVITDFCLPLLAELVLDRNYILTLQFKTFSSKNFPSLRYLYIKQQNNELSLPFLIGAKAFSNPSLKELHLEQNDIWFGRQDRVAADAFDNCTNLTSLYLDRNSLRDVDDDRFLELFGGLKSLKEFSLSDCQFEAISTKTFQTLTNLTHLFLDGNLISHIPSKTFETLQYIQLLDLSNNKLTVLSDQAFRQGFQYNLKLGLRRNPFICSCELIWLRECETESGLFVVVIRHFYGIRFVNDTAANYKCDNLKGFSVANFSLARQACLLSEHTSIMITYTCSLLVVALTAFLLLFAYRWHFRLLLYEAFRGNGQARRLRLQQNNFNYDVFVSYASEDLPWTLRHLMPQLEDRLGLRLCIHERDFIIGNNIVDNIAECVESSKKILMVFSKSFVLSQWCQFELTYCLTHVLEYDDSLIIVCVDDVVSHEMTSAMMAVLKTTTYIQWMEEEYATESFWGRIKIALQEIIDVGEHAV